MSATCPIDGRRYDSTTSYTGKPLPTRMRRDYCSPGCSRTAAQQRRERDTHARVAAALGPAAVAEVVAAAREAGGPVAVEGLRAPRRDGGLGALGAAERWAT